MGPEDVLEGSSTSSDEEEGDTNSNVSRNMPDLGYFRNIPDFGYQSLKCFSILNKQCF